MRERVAVPEGETWASTKPGAHYARIITGPRTGQYINLTHGERRGETFTIENRDGKKLHVYGESGTEVTIKPSVDAAATTEAAKHAKHPPSDRPAKGERWAPVEGHNNYADILEGPRNGLYVNISGGVRDGMAFQIVKKGEKVFHVYGTGKDQQMIQVAPKDDDKKAGNTERRRRHRWHGRSERRVRLHGRREHRVGRHRRRHVRAAPAAPPPVARLDRLAGMATEPTSLLADPELQSTEWDLDPLVEGRGAEGVEAVPRRVGRDRRRASRRATRARSASSTPRAESRR